MKIPPKLLDKLKGTELYDPVKDTVGDFTEWFKFSGTLFFREYTDHGNDHITEVCRSMTQLITPASWEYVTPADCAAIILSALLHDCAMHLTEDGFLELLENKNTISPLTAAPAPNWHELWDDYQHETKRWDEKKWKDITGGKQSVNELPKDPLDWSARHLRWIGEFIRRHHADIAYYIARYGLPGPNEKRLALERINGTLADIVGFIARSHNYPIRNSVDIWKQSPQKSRLDRSKVHIPYVMGLLRVADYLEIKSNRAPQSVLFRCRTLRSPLSEQEWLNHQAIHDINIHVRDVEALEVQAKPKDVKTFLSIESLQRNIQKELDETWASWGEVYSRNKKLNNLGMRYRRIRSNMDDVQEFGKAVNYIPVHAKFRTSEGELLKLLIEPLYDGRPEYGVRELIQNAVDACLERQNYKNRCPNSKLDLPIFDSNADVLVSIEEGADGSPWFTIEDSGVGMTADIIQKYFLTAGASYRTSDEWKEFYESQVVRSGRFGIGLLAAFLLGDEIQVTTRHITMPKEKAISMSCCLHDPEIELKWSTRKIGTTISIKLNDKALLNLIGRRILNNEVIGRNWDWYTGKTPKVVRRIRSRDSSILKNWAHLHGYKWEYLKQEHAFEKLDASQQIEWRCLQQNSVNSLWWSWLAPITIYNHFHVGEPHYDGIRGREFWIYNQGNYMVVREGVAFSILCPSIYISEKNTRTPLDLHRTHIDTSFYQEISKPLISSICRDILAFFLCRTPKSKDLIWEYLLDSLQLGSVIIDDDARLLHPGIRYRNNSSKCHYLMWNESGVILAEPPLVKNAKIDSICHILKLDNNLNSSPTKISDLVPAGFFGFLQNLKPIKNHNGENHELTIENWIRTIIDGTSDSRYHEPFNSSHIEFTHFLPFLPFKLLKSAVLIDNRLEKKNKFTPIQNIYSFSISKELTLYSTDKDPWGWLDKQFVTQYTNLGQNYVIGFWKIDPNTEEELSCSPLAKEWLEILSEPLISFDAIERESKLNSAYKELAPEIACWKKGGTYEAACELERQQRQNNT